MFKLDGKTALVTGATGGIGSAIARLLHAQGAKVVLSGTREAVLQKQAEELGEGRAFYVAANLSDRSEKAGGGGGNGGGGGGGMQGGGDMAMTSSQAAEHQDQITPSGH